MSIESEYAKVNVNVSEFDNGRLSFSDYFATPPMFFNKYGAEIPFTNRFNGWSGFIIAGGPSFNKIDKKVLAQPGLFTFGINNSTKTFRPNMWTCVDTPGHMLASIWMDPKIEKVVPISHINKPLTDSWSHKTKFMPMDICVGDCPNVVYYRRNEVVNVNQYLYEDTINWGNHSSIKGGRSVFMATMRIMYLLGFRKIFLLGVDMNMDDNNHYHFEQGRSQGSINNNNTTYRSMNMWFCQMRKLFDDVGFNVYNCNPDSKLVAFDYKSFDEAVDIALRKSMGPKKCFPDVKLERTDGMYTQQADKVYNAKVAEAQRIAQKYTEDERIKIKAELDKKRADLDVAKAKTIAALAALDNPPTDKQLKQWVKEGKKPVDAQLAEVYEIKKDEERIRQIFRACEVEKNRIHGIVKK